MDEAEEVLDMVLPSRDESAEVVHPSENPLYFPLSRVAVNEASPGFRLPEGVGLAPSLGAEL
jgi:hypothetical protein